MEIFDGDQAGPWDKQGGGVTPFSLDRDANRNGNAMSLVVQLASDSFVDNDWGVLYSGPHAAAAQSPSANYFYRLIITPASGGGVISGCKAVKVRVEKFHFDNGTPKPDLTDKAINARIGDGADDEAVSVKAFWQNSSDRRHFFLSDMLRTRRPPAPE